MLISRFDFIATMPGLVRSARTYSLILEDGTLYVINLGPAKGPTLKESALTRMVASGIEQRMNATVDASMAKLDARGPAAMASEKGSFGLAPGDVTRCSMGTNLWGKQALKLKTTARTFSFVPPPGGEEAVEAFGATIRTWAGLT